MADMPFSGEIHLHGRTNFGDSIEDEWLIVWILIMLSKQFPQLWTRTTDSMGEFLLVEAANVLPAWIDPEIAENRVWINKGQLRLIPVTSSSAKPAAQPGPLTLADVRQHIYEGKPTLHPTLVEKEAFHRLRDYPAQIQRNQHHALLTLPRKLAWLLQESPSYISAAVDAFYLRDPIAMKPLMVPNQDGLAFPPRDFVTSRVKFTRVGYAQVRSQRFGAPASWEGAERGYEDARFRERAELGLKVTAGFEMLIADPQRQDDRIVREIRMLLEDVGSGDVKLPSDEEIESWGTEGDDEKWLDIDFQDFEYELSGKKATGSASASTKPTGGFGDKEAQENLRKMVSRFEDFLNDDTLGPDDIDDDDDEESEADSEEASSDGEDKNASFTEDEFTKMMQEMMGMPADVMREIMTGQMPDDEVKRFAAEAQESGRVPSTEKFATKGKARMREVADDKDEIRELSAAMEHELRGVGALDISNPEKSKTSAFAKVKNDNTISKDEAEEEVDSDDGQFLDEDYNLVANMLESFKSQGGSAGPGGNLMSMLGVKMPRDDEEGEEDNGQGPNSVK